VNIDSFAEKFAVDIIREVYPSAYVVSEESGLIKLNDKADITFFLDPLNGTGNFIRGIPIFAVSVACALTKPSPSITLKNLKASAVATSFGMVFSSSQGKGAFLGDRELTHKHSDVELSDALIRLSPFEGKLQGKVNHVRLLGASCIELCFVAAGFLDAFIDYGTLKLTDIVAPYLIVKEAGGIMSDIYGNDFTTLHLTQSRLYSVVATKSTKLYKQLLRELGC